MSRSCKTGCRHLDEGYNGYHTVYNCGKKSKDVCLSGGFSLFEPNIHIVLKNEEVRILEILRYNSMILTTKSTKQIETYEHKRNLLIDELDTNVLSGKFAENRHFSTYGFGVNQYTLPLYESGKYWSHIKEITGIFCTKCLDGDFKLLFPAIKIKEKNRYSHVMTDRGGYSNNWTERTYRCPKCNDIGTVSGSCHEESDGCDLGTRAAGFGT